MNQINQVLIQTQAAYDAANWSLLTQCLLQLILETDSLDPTIVRNRDFLLELALLILVEGTFEQRWEIAKVFPRLGVEAISSLIAILKDEEADEELRWYAGRILGEFKQKEVVMALVELLKTDNHHPELRTMASAALGQIGSSAIDAVTELLASEKTRLLAVQSLSSIRNSETIKPLLSVVEDTQFSVRATAIEALSSFHDEQIPPILLKALDDPVAIVRQRAISGLGYRADLATELDLVSKLQPKLYDLDEDVCCKAAVALSQMGCFWAAKHLFTALQTPNTSQKLQLQIIRALSWMDNSGLEYLGQAVYELDSSILWQEIVVVLSQVTNPSLTNYCGKILLSMLERQHPAVEISSIKSTIALSLGQLGYQPAIESLKKMLVSSDVSVRLHASAALRNLVEE